MRKLAALLILLSPAWLLWSASGQELTGSPIFSRSRQFRIPFNLPPDGRYKQLLLFVSTDQGKSWQPSAAAPPEQKHFLFLADRDGYFWFAVQTVDLDKRLNPPTLEGVTPSLKVIIDTLPPAVQLQPLQPRGAEVGVAWDVRDDNLDLADRESAKLEFRAAGRGFGGEAGWSAVPMPPAAASAYWNPQTATPLEVRMRVKDRAGNVGETTTTIPARGFANENPNVQPNLGHLPEQQPLVNGPAEHERKLVNNKRISLNYELKEVGPSGVSAVELWYTTDGRGWNKYPLRFGEDPAQKNIVFDVVGEGIYGISLVAKSGVGLGERPPQMGDRPQIWIEVDTTKPQVQLHNVMVGTGPDKGKLSLTWTARDKNMHPQPITLAYAEQLSGPWTTIADKQPNSSRYVWQMPAEIPYQFHLKVEALDRAGNVGEAATESLIKVDLSQPKVKILNVEPAGK
ncbi:MAG: hypothetical protein L0Y72_29025 [Gemmataceae bacterium]|nr:hypothetical protein [Gemmataceae bacterium]